MWLNDKVSKRRIKEALNARDNRLQIVKAIADGQIHRRDLIKWGLVSAGGALMPIGGLSPFVGSAKAGGLTIPTGAAPSPGMAGLAFTQPFIRLAVQDRKPVSSLTPFPTAEANQTPMAVDPALGGGFGPIEGRPPGPQWAHQRFDVMPPQVAVEMTQEGAKDGANGPVRFHPSLATQNSNNVWTFNGR